MVRFYLTQDATEMMGFIVGCQPEFDAVTQSHGKSALFATMRKPFKVVKRAEGWE
jgi:hypothetical protein